MRAEEETEIATPNLSSVSEPFGLPCKCGWVASFRSFVVDSATPLVSFGIQFSLCPQARPMWVRFGFLLIAVFSSCTAGKQEDSPRGSGVAVHQEQDHNKILCSHHCATAMLEASERKNKSICSGLLLWEEGRKKPIQTH